MFDLYESMANSSWEQKTIYINQRELSMTNRYDPLAYCIFN